MTPFTATDERDLTASVEKVSALIEAGLSPTDAVTKVAGDRRYDDGRVRVLCHAVNAGNQLTRWEEGKTAVEKLSDFPVADPDAVIGRLYGPPVEKAAAVSREYEAGPAWLTRKKHLAWDAGVEKQAACPKVTPEPTLFQLKQARDRLAVAVIAHRGRFGKAASAVIRYFEQQPFTRCSLIEAKAAAGAYGYPEMLPFLDAITVSDPEGEKRAAEISFGRPEVLVRHFEACRVAGELHLAAQAALESVELLQKEAHAREFPVRAPEPVPCVNSIIPEEAEPVFKQATFLQSPALGMATGAVIGRSMQPILGLEDRDTQAVIDRYDDPKVDAELRRARVQAALTRLMTDPEDPLSTQDPRRTIDAYNQMAQVAPRAASQATLLGPLLRRQSGGLMDPFEVSQLLSIERTASPGAVLPHAPAGVGR